MWPAGEGRLFFGYRDFVGRHAQTAFTETAVSDPPLRLVKSIVILYDAVALAGMKVSGSSNLSFLRNSCRRSKRLAHI
jgi:hypothetical protein